MARLRGLRLPIGVCAAALLASCGHHGEQTPARAPLSDFERALQRQALHAAAGAVIEVPAGSYALRATLTLNAAGVTLRGAGSERSILSWREASAGTRGVVLNGNGIRAENLSIEDVPADGLTVTGRNDVLHGVQVAWTHGPLPTNGAFGLRAEGAQDLLIEDCAAFSAAGSGIYLGRSRNVIVRRCHLEQNVAGLVVTASTLVDVTASVATGNSVGVLVSGAGGVRGEGTRLFGNHIYKNNLANFAPRAAVAVGLSAGTGVALRAASRVEVFDNDISENQSANIFIGTAASGASAAARYPDEIFIHDNRFTGGGNAPQDGQLRVIRATLFGDGPLPDIVWDGRQDETRAGTKWLCVNNAPAQVLNAGAAHGSRAPRTQAVACELPSLPAVVLPRAR